MLGEPRIDVDECESTQLLLDPSLPEGAVATTRHQTGGRGRLGHTWQDVPGAALLFSVLLNPPAGRRPQELTLVAALAVAETVDGLIKWPNDVLIDGRKVSGGIAELRDGAVVLGIGVNVHQTAEQLPADARVPATSLLIANRERDVDDLLREILAALDGFYSVWRESGLAALHGHIRARDALRGSVVTVDKLSGMSDGIAADGRLEIAGNFVESGEVSL
ncbi:MAG TPA: biotin--[acetyl-CoA-carboxylase] ligase [Gaiellaceae bacterium]